MRINVYAAIVSTAVGVTIGASVAVVVTPQPATVVEVPGPIEYREPDELQCPADLHVAWDQRSDGGEWAYCRQGERPASAR